MAQSDRMSPQETRLRRLAKNIDGLAEKDRDRLQYAHEMAALRRTAAADLHAICAEFVSSLNRLVSRSEITLDPPAFSPDSFQEEGLNLFQINIHGRILRIEFEATMELISTEDFRIPYTLQGFVRAYNQEFLDQNIIEEQLVFYTVEKEKNLWRFFDARTYRSGAFDQEYLIGLMELLL